MTATTTVPSLRELVIVAITVLATLLLWHDAALWGGQLFCGGDLVNYEIPLREVWRGGPLIRHWNEYSFGGAPFLANPQGAVFYAPYWLTWALPVPVELMTTWQTLAHLAWGGVGMWALLRRPFGLAPALMAAVVWMTCGYQVGRIGAGILPFTAALSWLPWIWLLVERLGRPGSRAWAWLGLAAAAQFLVGATQVVHITACGTAVWVALRLAWPGTPKAERLRIIGHSALAGFVALLIIAPQLIASLALMREALGRGEGSDWDFIVKDSLEPHLLWTSLFPELFDAGTAEATYWGSATGYHETTAYVGVATLLLAAFGAVRAVTGWRGLDGERRRWLVSLAVLAVLGVALALGRHSWVYWAAYAVVPGVDAFRVPARWIIGLVVAVIVLAAWGLKELVGDGRDEFEEEGVGGASRQVILQWGAVAGGALLVIVAVRALLGPMLDWFGIDHFAPGGNEVMAMMRGRGRTSVDWALGMAVVGGALGALVLARRVPRAWGMGLLALVMVSDLLRFWQPWREPIPDTFEPWELGSEAPHHTIRGAAFRDWFYPETELVKALRAMKPGRILLLDDVMDYRFDQYTRELQGQRHAMQGIEMLRGYEPLQRRGIANDVARISGIEPVTATTMGSFLRVPLIADRVPLDAYNVTHVLSYGRLLDKGFAAEMEQLDLKLVHTTSFGLDVWENPHARGWAWVGQGNSKGWIDALPDSASGEVTSVERGPDSLQALVATEWRTRIYLSHSGRGSYTWSLQLEPTGARQQAPLTNPGGIGLKPKRNVFQVSSNEFSVSLPLEYRLTAVARSPGAGPFFWPLTGLAALSALIALGFGLWPRRQEDDVKD